LALVNVDFLVQATTAKQLRKSHQEPLIFIGQTGWLYSAKSKRGDRPDSIAGKDVLEKRNSFCLRRISNFTVLQLV